MHTTMMQVVQATLDNIKERDIFVKTEGKKLKKLHTEKKWVESLI